MADERESTAGFERVDHIGIVVRDVDAALPYYIDQLGMSLVHREELADIATELAYLDAGNTMIQLVAPIAPGFLSEHLDEQGEGLHHVCFGVDDIPAFLTAHGLHEQGPIFMGGRQRRACFLRERPNNLLIEVTENASDAG